MGDSCTTGISVFLYSAFSSDVTVGSGVSVGIGASVDSGFSVGIGASVGSGFSVGTGASVGSGAISASS